MNSFARILQFSLFVCLPCAGVASPPVREVTFLSASDSHYREPDHRMGCHKDRSRASVEEMNRITGTAWPEKLGSDRQQRR